MARPATAHALDRIRAEQARILYRNCPVGVLGAGTAAAVQAVGLVRAGRVDAAHASLWLGLMAGCVLLHLTLCVRFWHVRPPETDCRRWLHWFTLVALLEGITWFLGAFWMTSPTDISQELIVILLAGMVGLGSVPVFGSYIPAFLVYMIPVVIPHLYISLTYNYSYRELMAGFTIVYLLAVPLIAWRFNQQIVDGLRLRFENADLIEDLRQQKDRADHANITKSRFLASASHDLRQPIHALTLFVGALRARRMDGEARRLVDHIEGSINAMDGLFGSLLDISKLDAGVVEARVEAMALAPVLERLAREYRPEAASKGIALRFVPSTAIVRSDPVLLERIVRNLLANAVRYTCSGSVLLGCRHSSDFVSIEVLDTGPGIAPDLQSQIFDKFYQIGNPERDRSKGLGLGLAIVKRIAPLIECTLTLSSEPDRGSSFRLRVPRAARGELARSSERAPVTAMMRTGLIGVIDDELAIQQAMKALLTSWGHRVIVAGSLEDMLEQLRCFSDPLDLIICDYRLRAGETGLAAIEHLRGVSGVRIPAMLITGDTAPDRISEDEASGFLLLHKPLSNGKLRAAIGNLIRAG